MVADGKVFLASADEKLAFIIEQIPAPVIQSTRNIFHDLISCVLEQQIHYRSTKRVFEKMLANANMDMLTPDNFSHFEATAFSHIKLSSGKYETTLAVLDFFAGNQLNWETLTNQEVRTQLSAISGIGSWTIDMILLYTLERPDVFPSDDFHLKQVMVGLYGLDPQVKLKSQMAVIAKAWGGYQSLAVKYLLAWKTYQKNLMRDAKSKR